MLKKIVLTGGTFAGKSSILDLFKKDGYKVIPDIGYMVITDLNNRLGQEGQKDFRANNPVQFYEQILRRQLDCEAAATNRTVILDRGTYDYIAMMKLKDIAIPQSIYEQIKQAALYDRVFVLDTLSNFSTRTDSGRSLSREDSIKMNKLVSDLYEGLGCDVVSVQEMPLQDRYKYIKEHLE